MARAFFSGIDASGKVGLWVTHGTAGSTHEISVTGAASGGVLPQDITAFNHEAIFVGRAEQNTPGIPEPSGLWVTNGTAAGTHEIINIGVTSNLAVFHSEILFGGADAANNQGLWVTNGTAAGTHEITSIVSHSYDLTVSNNQVLFGGVNALNQQGLWVTDGTAAGTHEITVNGAGSGGIIPQGLTAFNGQVLFSAEGEASGNVGLWATDGTTAHEIPVDGAYATGVHPYEFTVFNGKVLFGGVDAAGNTGLWVTDGTTAGTHEITVNGAYFSGLFLSDLTVFNNEVLFEGTDAGGKNGLWVTDGTTAGTHEITVNGAPLGSRPSDLTVFNTHEVLFNAHGLWVTDGTTAGTHEITSIDGASLNGLNPSDLTVLGAPDFALKGSSAGQLGSTSQLVQAMAGFDGGSGAGESLNTAPLGADTSQQTLLTIPQHG
jgi:ELWxxDGT repeat protein